MFVPRPPVEGIRPDRFRPPHCPWPACAAHHRFRFRFSRQGDYRRKSDPSRRIPRFRCLECGRRFSRQTFSVTYYLKRPGLLIPVAAGLVAGSAHRQLARSLGCAPSTVTRLSARIGRHAFLFHESALRSLSHLNEPIVLDHFESFAFSQDDRLGIATAVGHRSWLTYALESAQHRRAGRRSRRKVAPRHALPENVAGEVVRSTRRTLDFLLERSGRLVLHTDDHPAYRIAIARHPGRKRIRHRVFPNPHRGPEADRTLCLERDRAMFPVDLLHGLLRHSQAHHRRETIAFGRRANALMERAALAVVWRNFVKLRSERRPRDATTPAMKVGLADHPLTWPEIFARRLFPMRVRLHLSWQRLYDRDLQTPAVGRNQRHRLRHAY